MTRVRFNGIKKHSGSNKCAVKVVTERSECREACKVILTEGMEDTFLEEARCGLSLQGDTVELPWAAVGGLERSKSHLDRE